MIILITESFVKSYNTQFPPNSNVKIKSHDFNRTRNKYPIKPRKTHQGKSPDSAITLTGPPSRSLVLLLRKKHCRTRVARTRR